MTYLIVLNFENIHLIIAGFQLEWPFLFASILPISSWLAFDDSATGSGGQNGHLRYSSGSRSNAVNFQSSTSRSTDFQDMSKLHPVGVENEGLKSAQLSNFMNQIWSIHNFGK